MKTSIKTLMSAPLFALVLLMTAAAFPVLAVQQPNAARRITAPKFRKIMVSGNIDVLLVQNKKSGVIINEDSQQPGLKVSQKGETLLIASRQTRRVQVTVYVEDIFRIDASNSASVKTFNKLNLKYLQVFLHDDATAEISANTESLYTVMAGKSRLNLSGMSLHHAVVMSKLAMLTMRDFVSAKSDVKYSDHVAVLKR